jgi:Predicted methyltransferase regulatory domain
MLVTDLLEEAEGAGLVYLGDAIPASVALETLPESAARRASALPVRGAQQMVDFVRCTAFRRALFVRKDKSLARGWSFPTKLDMDKIRSLRVASRLRPAGPACFEGPNASVQATSSLSQAALLELYEHAPQALTFDVLLERANRRLGRPLVEGAVDLAVETRDLWLAIDGIDLHDFAPPFDLTVTDKPKACPLARFLARTRQRITNRWHQEVVLREPVVHDVLAQADGSRSVAELARIVSADEELVRASLVVLAKSALLVG